jgi:tetratricopeptide (TPR) repeat protein
MHVERMKKRLTRWMLGTVRKLGISAWLVAMPQLQAQDPAPGVGVLDAAKAGSLPAYSEVLSKKAAAAFAERNWKVAREAYREMLKDEPVNALAWANLGAVEQQAGDLNAAIEAFEQSVRFNPALVQSWIALGLAYSERGDKYRAVSALARAVHEDPTDPRAHNYLAIVANQFGWTATAQAEFEKAIALKPDYGIAHFNLALTYLEQKPPALELARRHYEAALKLGVEKDEIVDRKLKEEP